MGSQTSTSRHQALSDAHQSGIPGIGPVHGRDLPGQAIQLQQGAHPHQHQGAPLAHVPEGVLATPSRTSKESSAALPVHDKDELIPCVFCWAHGGHNVYLTGSFNNWSVENKIRLVRSGHEFACIKNLSRGVHLYKFIVDDQWKYAPDQQTQSDEHGNINNVLDITNFTHYHFKIPTEYELAHQALYHQYIPEPAEYSTDAPTIPILLSKSTCVAAEPPPRNCIPLLCISNYVYHDAHASTIFGPHVSCIAATQRWRQMNVDLSSGQRYSTYTYITINPLFPTPVDPSEDYGIPNPLKTLIACKNPSRDPNAINNSSNSKMTTTNNSVPSKQTRSSSVALQSSNTQNTTLKQMAFLTQAHSSTFSTVTQRNQHFVRGLNTSATTATRGSPVSSSFYPCSSYAGGKASAAHSRTTSGLSNTALSNPLHSTTAKAQNAVTTPTRKTKQPQNLCTAPTRPMMSAEHVVHSHIGEESAGKWNCVTTESSGLQTQAEQRQAIYGKIEPETPWSSAMERFKLPMVVGEHPLVTSSSDPSFDQRHS